MQFRSNLYLTAVLSLCITSCATTVPEREVVSPEEQSRYDRSIGTQLAASLENQFRIEKEIEVSVYLRQLAERLAKTVPDLDAAPLGVLIVKSDTTTWRNYSLPGNRVYVSAGLLRNVNYESELAAALAFELSHLQHRHLLKRNQKLQNEQNQDLAAHLASEVASASPQATVETSLLFSFSQEELLQSAESAVAILYGAGIDPRGLTQLWKIYASSPARSPYDKSTLALLEQRTRQEIANRTPLRNPLVRSRAFLQVQPRLKQL